MPTITISEHGDANEIARTHPAFDSINHLFVYFGKVTGELTKSTYEGEESSADYFKRHSLQNLN